MANIILARLRRTAEEAEQPAEDTGLKRKDLQNVFSDDKAGDPEAMEMPVKKISTEHEYRNHTTNALGYEFAEYLLANHADQLASIASQALKDNAHCKLFDNNVSAKDIVFDKLRTNNYKGFQIHLDLKDDSDNPGYYGIMYAKFTADIEEYEYPDGKKVYTVLPNTLSIEDSIHRSRPNVYDESGDFLGTRSQDDAFKDSITEAIGKINDAINAFDDNAKKAKPNGDVKKMLAKGEEVVNHTKDNANKVIEAFERAKETIYSGNFHIRARQINNLMNKWNALRTSHTGTKLFTNFCADDDKVNEFIHYCDDLKH